MHDLAAVRPIMGVYSNKLYQNTQKIILRRIKQEKSQVIQLSTNPFQILQKSRIPQPNSTFTQNRFLQCCDVFPVSHCLCI